LPLITAKVTVNLCHLAAFTDQLNKAIGVRCWWCYKGVKCSEYGQQSSLLGCSFHFWYIWISKAHI